MAAADYGDTTPEQRAARRRAIVEYAGRMKYPEYDPEELRRMTTGNDQPNPISGIRSLHRAMVGSEVADRQERIARQAEIQTHVKNWISIGVLFIVSACIIAAAIISVIWLALVVFG
jgi:hypothetical protein